MWRLANVHSGSSESGEVGDGVNSGFGIVVDPDDVEWEGEGWAR